MAKSIAHLVSFIYFHFEALNPERINNATPKPIQRNIIITPKAEISPGIASKIIGPVTHTIQSSTPNAVINASADLSRRYFLTSSDEIIRGGT